MACVAFPPLYSRAGDGRTALQKIDAGDALTIDLDGQGHLAINLGFTSTSSSTTPSAYPTLAEAYKMAGLGAWDRMGAGSLLRALGPIGILGGFGLA